MISPNHCAIISLLPSWTFTIVLFRLRVRVTKLGQWWDPGHWARPGRRCPVETNSEKYLYQMVQWTFESRQHENQRSRVWSIRWSAAYCAYWGNYDVIVSLLIYPIWLKISLRWKLLLYLVQDRKRNDRESSKLDFNQTIFMGGII